MATAFPGLQTQGTENRMHTESPPVVSQYALTPSGATRKYGLPQNLVNDHSDANSTYLVRGCSDARYRYGWRRKVKLGGY